MSLLSLSLLLASGLGATRYSPLEMHELIGLADLAFAGTIVDVGPRVVTVRIDHAGFGAAPGATVPVARFVDWACASRWDEYAVGQTCVYFLERGVDPGDPYRILSGGGEGEMPLDESGGVRMRARLGGRNALGRRPLVEELLEECRRYRALFHFRRGISRTWWIEPRVGETELESYRASSVMAGFLCARTFRRRYHDGEARSPRPADALPRIDLGIGGRPAALAALPDLDGDGIGEIACAIDDELRILHPDASGTRKATRRIDGCADAVVWKALALAGDLDGDGRPELAAGGCEEDAAGDRSGFVQLVSVGAEAYAPYAMLRPEDPVFGAGAPPWERFGDALAGLGDLDGDGTFELAVSAAAERAGAWLWIVSLDRSGRPQRVTALVAGEGIEAGRIMLVSPGDIDGNGIADLAAGLPASASGPTSSAVRLFFLERTLAATRTIDVPGDGRACVGSFLAAAGDRNDDGVPDLALGAKGNAEARVLLLARDGHLLGQRLLRLPSDLPEEAYVSDRLLGTWWRRPDEARVLCASFSWLEPEPGGPASWDVLRRYPSLWALEGSGTSAGRVR